MQFLLDIDNLDHSQAGWRPENEAHTQVKGPHLAEVDIEDPKDNGERELGSVDGEEPLGGVHVRLNPMG